MMKQLDNVYELKNVKPSGFGFEFLNSAPGAFIVLECSAQDEPVEIARFVHDGKARSRDLTYSKALSVSRKSQTYDGSQCDYNVYEETEAPDGGLSVLSPEELSEVIRIAREIPRDIRRKKVTLKVLRTLERADSLDNPYHTYPRPVTARVWRPIFLSITDRLNTTNEGMADLAKRALALLCPYNVGDRVVYAGAVCLVTTVNSDGSLLLDRSIPTTPSEITLADVEPARDLNGLVSASIAEDIERESHDPRSTKPTARAYLASMINHQIESYPRFGTRFDKGCFLSHLDNCCAYGVLNRHDHEAITSHFRKKKIGDFRRINEILCACLLAGSNIANTLLELAI